MRYICTKCGTRFCEPDRATFAHESWDCCPNCGCADFEATAKCICCGNDFPLGDLIAQSICAECLEDEADNEDYYAFAHDALERENFAEFLIERYSELWSDRRRRPYRKEKD